MKYKKPYLLTIIFLLIQFYSLARSCYFTDSVIRIQRNQNGINIFIISKDKYFDITNRIILWQAKLAALFHPKKLKIVIAVSTADAEKKISALVTKHYYVINNIWFDSHGKYRKGYSSFMIGSDEYDYKNIADSAHLSELKKIAAYCNKNTKVGIGSCYAAADFDFPVLKNGKYQNMHGDSLLKGLAKIFNGSSVYASDSWVMAKPWIFGSKNALAGYPLDRQYKDSIFLPVWKRMGEWKVYSTLSKQIETTNTIYLSRDGDIEIPDHNYMAQKKAQRKLARNLRKLQPGLYTL